MIFIQGKRNPEDAPDAPGQKYRGSVDHFSGEALTFLDQLLPGSEMEF